MKAFVITIKDHVGSNQCAERCIKSASNIEITKFDATTPENVHELFEQEGLNPNRFIDQYSVQENAMACFMSHYRLWQLATELNEDVIIFEHDAVIHDDILFGSNNGCISFGKPSYGKYNTPKNLGVNPLQSKQYFPGAHAYLVSPQRAKQLVAKAKTHAAPTDLFLHNGNFGFLEEYYPWPVTVNDSFTTIQKSSGCTAKHNYNETYRIDTDWENITGGQDF